MTRLHASALLEADSMACRKFFSMMSDVKRVVQKNEVSTGVMSSASLVVFSLETGCRHVNVTMTNIKVHRSGCIIISAHAFMFFGGG